jgi:hypothetical protein
MLNVRGYGLPRFFISLCSLLWRSEQQLQADAESSTPILDEAQALVETDGIVPGGVGLRDDAPVAALAGDVHQVGDDCLADALSAIGLARRDTYHLADPLATADECPGADQFAPHADHHEDMAREDVVVQNIIQVRVDRFVDGAEVLAQPFEDEPTRLLLVVYLKGPDAEFAFHARLLLIIARCVGK